jgi:hypothetical protein
LAVPFETLTRGKHAGHLLPFGLQFSDSAVAMAPQCRARLEQMDRLDKAFHNIRHEFTIGSDRLARAREY